jgi:ribosomal protein S6--L-glutamate ligase
MDNFKSFITEAKEEPYRLLILSNKPKNQQYFRTAQRLVDESKKAGIESYVLFVESGKIIDGKAYQFDDKKGFEIDSSNTVAIVRGSVASRDAWMDMVSQLEKMGICCVNSRRTIEMCADKYWTSLRLSDSGIPTPKTSLLQSEEQLQNSLDIIGEDYPLILKTLRGSKGIGVIFIESKRQLSSLIQLLWKQDAETEILLQTYIKSDFDVRVIVLNGKIQATMRRDVLKGDFRSNYSRGAKVKQYKLSDEEISICLKADKSVNGVWTAVDFIKKGKDTFVLEVNSSPGTEGIEEATGNNILKELIEHFKNKSNWRYTALEIGHREIVSIKPFGEIQAKFDTGNSASASTIHADKIDVNGKKVTWSYNGKTLTSKLQRTVKVDVGGLNNYTEERYAILLDIEFAGSIYKDVEILLDNREGRSPLLFNRDFMRRSNVMVNPARKYVITTPFTLDK